MPSPHLPLAAVGLAMVALLAGCDTSAGPDIDRRDPVAVAKAYAIADHALDHDTVYQVLGPEVRDGADQKTWVANQHPDGENPGRHYLARRYRGDRCNARTRQPRQIATIELRDHGEPGARLVEPGLHVVGVVIEFADGQTRQCRYGLRQTPTGRYDVVATDEP
jgi:hypothetical protein